MAKAELEFHRPDDSRWEKLNDKGPGVYQKILTHDAESGNYTRLFRFEPGADLREGGVLTHEHWEEVWIIEGSLTDLSLGKTFLAGSYACRPPGMKHGPYRSDDGALMFEVRYYLK
ncbi:MAG: cupin domain-containing protein [Candidatus Binataceae bacterium]